MTAVLPPVCEKQTGFAPSNGTGPPPWSHIITTPAVAETCCLLMIEIYISIRVSLPTLPAVRPVFIYLFYPPCFHGNPNHSGEPLSTWYLSHMPGNYTFQVSNYLLDGRRKHQQTPKLKQAIWPVEKNKTKQKQQKRVCEFVTCWGTACDSV